MKTLTLLIVVVLVLGVLLIGVPFLGIYLSANSANSASVVCRTQTADLLPQNYTITAGNFIMPVLNKSGVKLSEISAHAEGDFANKINFVVTPTTVDSGLGFAVQGTAPGQLGRFANGVIQVSYKKGIDSASGKIYCSGST